MSAEKWLSFIKSNSGKYFLRLGDTSDLESERKTHLCGNRKTIQVLCCLLNNLIRRLLSTGQNQGWFLKFNPLLLTVFLSGIIFSVSFPIAPLKDL